MMTLDPRAFDPYVVLLLVLVLFTLSRIVKPQ